MKVVLSVLVGIAAVLLLLPARQERSQLLLCSAERLNLLPAPPMPPMLPAGKGKKWERTLKKGASADNQLAPRCPEMGSSDWIVALAMVAAIVTAIAAVVWLCLQALENLSLKAEVARLQLENDELKKQLALGQADPEPYTSPVKRGATSPSRVRPSPPLESLSTPVLQAKLRETLGKGVALPKKKAELAAMYRQHVQ